MSKEFEEVVLKKLNELSTELKDTKQELKDFAKDTNQRLQKVEVELKDTKQELKDFAKDTNQRLQKVEVELKDTKQELKDLAKDTNQRLEKVELDFRDTKEIVMDLRQRFAVFDFEINRKIDTLFDSDIVNKENIVSLNVKNYNHDTRITNLENKDLSFAKA